MWKSLFLYVPLEDDKVSCDFGASPSIKFFCFLFFIGYSRLYPPPAIIFSLLLFLHYRDYFPASIVASSGPSSATPALYTLFSPLPTSQTVTHALCELLSSGAAPNKA